MTKAMPFALLVVCASAMAGMPGIAYAQSEAEQEALRHYERGQQLMEDGAYKKAANAFKDSYQAKRAPLLLYNIGQAYREAGEDRKAIDYYEDFLSEEPDLDPFSDRAREYLEILQKKIDREDEDVGVDPDAGDEDPGRDPIGDRGDEDESRDDLTGDTAGTIEKGDKEPGKVWRYSGIGLMGAGLVSLVVGAKFGYDTYRGWRCLEQYQSQGACAGVLANHDPNSWTKEADDYQKRGFPITRAKMYIFTGLGAASIVGGGAIYYYGKKLDNRERRSRERAINLAPEVSNESLGVALTGRF